MHANPLIFRHVGLTSKALRCLHRHQPIGERFPSRRPLWLIAAKQFTSLGNTLRRVSRPGNALQEVGNSLVMVWHGCDSDRISPVISKARINVKPNTAALMTQMLAELVYQAIESAMETDVAVSSAVLDRHRVWLRLLNESFSIMEQEFLAELGGSSPNVAAIDRNVPSGDVVEALLMQLRGGASALQTLLQARHHAFKTKAWPVTMLARAKIAGRYVFVGTGFEKISKSDYWLAIAETSDPNDLRAYKLLTEPIHQALNDLKPVMLAALTHSPQALAAIIELDKALQILPEKRELLEAAGPGTLARMPTRL